jgi:hypothetical protein
VGETHGILIACSDPERVVVASFIEYSDSFSVGTLSLVFPWVALFELTHGY